MRVAAGSWQVQVEPLERDFDLAKQPNADTGAAPDADADADARCSSATNK